MEAVWKEPFERFAAIYAKAEATQPKDPNAVALATVDATGFPSVRMVLMKGFDTAGFVIFTHYDSRKGRELSSERRAALCFYWPSLDQQIRVEGTAEKVSAEESDAYFASRPRASQIGAWASRQSQPLDERATLIERVAEFTLEFEGRDVPRPPGWGGFRIVPHRFEFWAAGENRLHQRTVFELMGERWNVSMLYP